jgi:hypothetical protein
MKLFFTLISFWPSPGSRRTEQRRYTEKGNLHAAVAEGRRSAQFVNPNGPLTKILVK